MSAVASNETIRTYQVLLPDGGIVALEDEGEALGLVKELELPAATIKVVEITRAEFEALPEFESNPRKTWTFASSLEVVPVTWRAWACLAPSETALYDRLLKEYGRTERQADAMGLLAVRVADKTVPSAHWDAYQAWLICRNV